MAERPRALNDVTWGYDGTGPGTLVTALSFAVLDHPDRDHPQTFHERPPAVRDYLERLVAEEADQKEPFSITDHLGSYEWSNEETAAYEAAIEAVNGAVGAYSALIASEKAKPEPDQAVITEARAGSPGSPASVKTCAPPTASRSPRPVPATRSSPARCGSGSPDRQAEIERYRLP
ncbi:hypothetical protein [Streptomyces dangxiongensis]|uniref:hypothetical protein n=1 Tax=Streptomyces dangxiongensis TaxID=1442032 RepID=UPI001F095AC4|nr:hypothetical protein [Streptomyces dangxiongensis]